MAFKKSGFYFSSVGMGPLNTAVYKNITDSLATIKTSDYFPEGTKLAIDDKIYIVGSDGREDVYVSGVNPLIVASITAAPAVEIFGTGVGLASGATDVFAIPGVLSTDYALAMFQEETTGEIESLECGTDQVTLWYEGSVSSKKVFIIVFR